MRYAEIIDRASQLAQGVQQGENPMDQSDREITAETIYPHAVRAVYRQQAKTGKHLENLSFQHPIEIVAGLGTMPDTVLREYMDRSYLPQVTFASRVPFEDYQRFRFNSQISYYSDRGSKLFYSGYVPKRLTVTGPTFTATLTSITITGNASGAAVGDHFYLLDTTNGLVAHAVIASINGTTNFTIRGTTRVATSAAMAGIFTSGQDDIVLRSVTDLVTNTASANVSSATATFTAADVGRRLRAYQTGTTTVVVDAIITALVSATAVTLGAKPLSTLGAADASVLYSPLFLQAVGIPALPSSLCTGLDLVTEIAEDVIVMIASVLRNEMPLAALIEVANGGKRK